MTIKFPDFQVLVSRSEQVPRPTREGEPGGAAGKMAPQVAQEFATRQKRPEKAGAQEKIKEWGEKERRGASQEEEEEPKEGKKRRGQRRRIDLRA